MPPRTPRAGPRGRTTRGFALKPVQREWTGEDVALADVLRRLAALRSGDGEAGAAPELRTNVMTHIAWVPPEWLEPAHEALEGLAERHPSRTILLVPYPGDGDGIDAQVSVLSFPIEGSQLRVSTEVVELRLRGCTSRAPASVVWPLLISDLPVFCRWRGLPPFGAPKCEQLLDVADRLIVDSTEWPGLPDAYRGVVPVFDRTAVSDIAWARTGRWRALLASLWPDIAQVKTIRVRGTEAQAWLLGGWLRSRLDKPLELEHDPSERLEGIELDGEPAPFPPGDPPPPSELLSEELETFGRDAIYEAAVRAAASA